MASPVIALAAVMILTSVPVWAAALSGSPAGPGRSGPAAAPTIACPGDTVVWVNPRSKAYHLQGDSFFGRTKRGKFECKKAADAQGDHPVPARK